MPTHPRTLRRAGTLLALAAITCSGLDRIDVSTESATTIEGSLAGLLAAQLGFNEFGSLDISQEEELENQGVEKHEIDSVKIRTITLTITDTSSGQNFDFLDSCEFYVESEGLERKRIATGSAFAPGLTSVGLDIDDVELAPYATAASMEFTTEVQGDPPAEDTTILADIDMDVDVNVSGVICGG